jgi:hypothetical protein
VEGLLVHCDSNVDTKLPRSIVQLIVFNNEHSPVCHLNCDLQHTNLLDDRSAM